MIILANAGKIVFAVLVISVVVLFATFEIVGMVRDLKAKRKKDKEDKQ